MALRTLRGTVGNAETKRLIVDDGRLTHGYKVVRFEIFPVDVSSGAADCTGVLSLDYDGATEEWHAFDNRQIGWASSSLGGPYSVTNKSEIIDPDHIVIQDLWIQAYSSVGANPRINYLIQLEPRNITENEAILSLIKERSQDDLR